MHDQFKMRVLGNDLDSMVVRIEDLPPHPKLTDALNAVQAARDAVRTAAGDLHQADIRRRYDIKEQ